MQDNGGGGLVQIFAVHGEPTPGRDGGVMELLTQPGDLGGHRPFKWGRTRRRFPPCRVIQHRLDMGIDACASGSDCCGLDCVDWGWWLFILGTAVDHQEEAFMEDGRYGIRRGEEGGGAGKGGR